MLGFQQLGNDDASMPEQCLGCGGVDPFVADIQHRLMNRGITTERPLSGLTLPQKLTLTARGLRRLGMSAIEAEQGADVLIYLPPVIAKAKRSLALGDYWDIDWADLIPDWLADAYHVGESGIKKGIEFALRPDKAILAFISKSTDLLLTWLGKILAALHVPYATQIVNLIKAVLDSANNIIEIPLNLIAQIVPKLIGLGAGVIRNAALCISGNCSDANWGRSGTAVADIFSICMNALSTVLLDSPLVVGLIGALRIDKDPQLIRQDMKQASRKDPTFGLRAVMFIIGLIYGGGWSKIVAKPAGFMADVLGLHRIVVRETLIQEFGFRGEELKIFDMVYGIVILALNEYLDGVSALTRLGTAAGTARTDWNNLTWALENLNFKAIIEAFTQIALDVKRAKSNVQETIAAGKQMFAAATAPPVAQGTPPQTVDQVAALLAKAGVPNTVIGQVKTALAAAPGQSVASGAGGAPAVTQQNAEQAAQDAQTKAQAAREAQAAKDARDLLALQQATPKSYAVPLAIGAGILGIGALAYAWQRSS